MTPQPAPVPPATPALPPAVAELEKPMNETVVPTARKRVAVPIIRWEPGEVFSVSPHRWKP